jgi:N-acetylneuraminate lyase
MNQRLTGLIAAPHTPFHPDGTVATEVIPQQARLLARNGVTGAFVCGTTGEGSSLTSAERRQVVEAWVAAKPAALALIVHVGHLSLGDACELARHAQECGADAIAALAPSFFKPASATELVAWCAQLAAAAPRLPFYYYHIPAMTGVTIPVADFLNSVNGQIPTLAGIKFTHENLMDFGQSVAIEGGRYDMLFGRDEILLSGIALGARGAVGSTYNYAAPLYLRIFEAFARGDLAAARCEQSRAMEMIAVLNRHGGMAAGKAAMKLIGIDCGPLRLPIRSLTPRDEESLRAGLDQVGFFEYCSRVA